MQIPNADVGQGLPALLDTRSFTTAPMFAAFLRVDPNHLCKSFASVWDIVTSSTRRYLVLPKNAACRITPKPLMSLLYHLIGNKTIILVFHNWIINISSTILYCILYSICMLASMSIILFIPNIYLWELTY